MNEGSKLALGSTAKLRTLISYLEIVEQLYLRNAGRPAVNLRREPVGTGDWITAWTLAYLAANPGVSLERILEAAMSRPYSASPSDSLTGGDSHMFRNVDSTDDHETVSVRDAFVRSVNLPFIRIMRDIVHYYVYRLPGSVYLLRGHLAEMTWDRDDRMADGEGGGRELIEQFYQKYADADSGSVLEALRRGRTVTELAWAYRSVRPEAGLGEFGAFFGLSDERIAELYDGSDPLGFSVSDRGRLAGMHPLELWVAAYLYRHPGALQQDVLDASASVREQHDERSPHARPVPDRRIGSIPETEAFREIHRAWARLGYPFESLMPSYATAIGSSADRPDDLAELVGILLNDGIRYPVQRVEELHYAAGTPYETVLRRSPPRGERVLSSEIAAVVRAAMVAGVTRGTARRAFGAVRAADGSPLVIGAKTGTGDNRFRVVGRDGRVSEDRAIDRTATVVFFIGDRFYGTITAFVSGAAADRYSFTSSLPLQILKMLGPTLEALMAGLTSEPCRSVRPYGQTDRARPSPDTCRSPQ